MLPLPPIRLDGDCPDWMQFSVGSFTVADLWYEVRIDRRKGVIECTCPDSSCRRKRGDLVNWFWGKPYGGCKHVRALLTEVGARLLIEELCGGNEDA
jgi:hypothetical protein